MSKQKQPQSKTQEAAMGGAASDAKMDKKIASALASIEKDLKLTIGTVTSMKFAQAERIPSGSLLMDAALGGGWARGRVHEVYGVEGGGKTTMCLLGIAQAQRQGLNTAFIDVEHAFDPVWAKSIGVDPAKLILTQPSSGEDALTVVERLAETGKIGLIVLDSVAALVPQAEIDGDMGDAHVGVQARMMGQALRKLTPTVGDSNTALIFINQIRLKVGVMFGNPEVTPGGMALKYYSSIRVDVRKASKTALAAADAKAAGWDLIDPEPKDAETGQVTGYVAKIAIKKNKTFYPFREAVVPISYVGGLRTFADTLVAGVQAGVLVRQDGDAFTYTGSVLPEKSFPSARELHSLVYSSGALDALRGEIRDAFNAQQDKIRQAATDNPTMMDAEDHFVSDGVVA